MQCQPDSEAVECSPALARKLRRFFALPFARLSVEKHDDALMIELTEKEKDRVRKTVRA